MATTEPIRNKKQLRELAGYWLKRGSIRNYTLIVMGVGTALRISDLLHMLLPYRRGDYIFANNRIDKKASRRQPRYFNGHLQSFIL